MAIAQWCPSVLFVR